VRSDRAVQDAVRDQLVAAVAPERPRRRRRTLTLAVLAALLGATAAAEATGLLAVGEPIESLLPAHEQPVTQRYRAPHGATLVLQAPDADHRYAWAVGIYRTARGEDCAIAGQVYGTMLGRERDGRFRPYGPGVVGSCGRLGRLKLMSDLMPVPGPHPRTLLYGRTTRSTPPVYRHRGELHRARLGRGGAFLLVFDGLLQPADLTLVDPARP
jgi:hypothetical protein